MSDQTTKALTDTVDALGKIMLEMQRRRLLARNPRPRERAMLDDSNPLTDEQVGNIAAAAFELGAMELARLSRSLAMVVGTDPSRGPKPWET